MSLFMFELPLPAEKEQLDSAGGDRKRTTAEFGQG
jgi:hypothetical protein